VPPASGDATGAGASGRLGLIGLDALELEDVDISYVDEVLDATYTLQLERLDGSAEPDNTIRLRLEGELQGLPYTVSLLGDPLTDFLAPNDPWAMDLTANGGGAELHLWGLIAGPDDPGDTVLSFAVDGERLGALALWLPVKSDAQISYEASGQVLLSPEILQISNLSARMGETRFTGQSFWSEQDLSGLPKVELRFQTLDIGEVSHALETDPAAAGGLSLTALYDSLRRLDAEIDLAVDRLPLPGITIEGLAFKGTLDEGHLPVSPVSARIGESSVDGTLDLDLRGEPHAVNLKLQGRDVKLRSLVNTWGLAGADNARAGRFGFEVSTRGQSWESLLQSSSLAIAAEDVSWTLISRRTREAVPIRLEQARLWVEPSKAVQLAVEGSMEGQPFALKAETEPLSGLFDASGDAPLQLSLQAREARLELEARVAVPLGGEISRLYDSRIRYSEPKLGLAVLVDELEIHESRQIRAGQIDIERLYATLRIDAERLWHLEGRADTLLHGYFGDIILLREEPQSSGRETDAPTGGTTAELESPVDPEPWVYRIERLTVGKDSQLAFRDESVGTPYEATLTVDHYELTKVHNDETHREPTSLEFRAKINRHADLRLSGSLTPPVDGDVLSVNTEIEAVELPPLSPYSAEYGGFEFDSGQMDGELRLSIGEGEISGVADVVLHGVEVSPSDKRRLRELKKKLGVSLETAVRLLAEDDGAIRLSIPISGKADEATFDIQADTSGAVKRALGELAVAGMVLVEPLTVVIASAIESKNTRYNYVESLRFDPGSARLEVKSLKFLDDAAKRMKKRPETRVKICGIAVKADRQALGSSKEQPAAEQELLELADARAVAVKDYMITQHQIAANRLIACRSRYDDGLELEDTEHATPRIDLWR
jgi:hypothetical protein